MTADIPSVLSKDGTDGRGRPSDGTVDNTVHTSNYVTLCSDLVHIVNILKIAYGRS